jgi:hypothetical protein
MDDLASVEQQLADLADLKAAKTRRDLMARGTPEWVAAIGVEEELAGRITRWSRPLPEDRR